MRRHIAESRTGAIIRTVSTSRRTELFLLVFAAVFVLTFRGSSAEGQASLFSSLATKYVRETALAFNAPSLSGTQQADINSLFAGSGGPEDSGSPAPTLEASAIRDSALVALAPPDSDYIDTITSHRSGIVEYTVQEGDLLSFVASDYGVSMNSIIWANSLKNADSISPGDILRIPPVTGVIHKAKTGDTVASLAKKYSADAERIIAYNQLPKDGSIAMGDEIVIPDGKVSGAVAPVVVGGVGKIAQAITQFAHLPDLGEYFKIPTTGRDWGIIHGRNGVDIANSCGTPVYAAADGMVTVSDGSGFNGGFGKYIKISHANGTETLYAHSSKLIAQVGQVVARGQQIMLMGTTGRSTGCHLHFEVHGAHNPLAKN